MKAEYTIDKPARAGRATQMAAMGITGLVAFIWMYFGRLYLIHDPGEWRIANQQLGYPLYIIPLIGVTHILGGVGLLIPSVPRLTEWIWLNKREDEMCGDRAPSSSNFEIGRAHV